MKKRTIITSILVIVLCLGLISGSTFALFTSESKVNIAVTSGKVKLTATLGSTPVLYSADATLDSGTPVDKKDSSDTTGKILPTDPQGEFAGTYYYKAQQGTYFANGGTATLSGGTLTIDKMTPGDKVATDLTIKNESNVAIKYRLKIVASAVDETDADTSKILEVLKVRFEGILYTGLASYTSSWITKAAPASDFEEYKSKIEVIFPLDAGNEYQANRIELNFTVEAVQANANTVDTGTIEYVEASSPVTIATATSVVTTVPNSNDTTATLVAASAPTNDEEKTTEVTLTNVGAKEDTVKLTVESHDVSAAAATQYTIVGQNNTAAGSIDLTLTVNDTVVSQFADNASAKIVTYVAKGLTGVNVIYNGDENKAFGTKSTTSKVENEADVNAVGKYYYDATTGKLVFITDHFSEYVVTTSAKVLNETTNTAYSSLEAAVTALTSGETIKLLRDIDLSGTYTVRNARDIGQGYVFDLKDCILDLNRNTIKSINASVTFAGDGAVIENGTFDLVEKDTDGSYKDGSYALIIDNDVADYGKTGTVAVKDVTCDGGINICCATVTLDNVTSHTTTTKYYAVWAELNAILTINSGTYTDTQESGKGIIATGTGAEGGAKVYIKGGTFVGTNKLVYSTETNAIEITGGTFDHDPTSYVVEGYGVQTVGDKYVVEALFDGGDGTESNPYLISSAKQLTNINKEAEGTFFKLTDDIVLTSSDYSTVPNSVFENSTLNALISNFNNKTLDGNNHTISVSADDSYIFSLVENSTIKNLTVDYNSSSSSIIYAGHYYTFNNVDTTGDLVFNSGNCAAFVVYSYYDATFIDCINKAYIHSTSGDETIYDAVFIGYGLRNGNVTFTNCKNEGTLVCGKASMFMANWSYKANLSFAITNCVNTGLIRSTSPTYYNGADNYNYCTSDIWDKAGSLTFSFNGGDLLTASTSTKWYDVTAQSSLVGLEGAFVTHSDDPTLALTKELDGTFTITPSSKSEEAAYYMVSVGTYTGIKNNGGSSRVYATENNITGTTTTLKALSFVDSDWVTAHPTAIQSTLAGNTIYTLDNVSYYLINRADQLTLGGNVTEPQMISVSVFDNNGRLLSAAILDVDE